MKIQCFFLNTELVFDNKLQNFEALIKNNIFFAKNLIIH